ncbi:MAG: hypothetical protein LBD47_09080 [Treponema sp.]|jgi:hypothetical protein|nr:hypothetical protein [Treponema sp.]
MISGKTGDIQKRCVVLFRQMNRAGFTSVYDETIAYACFKTLCVPLLRRAGVRCVASIFGNFFFRQYRAALLPGRVPVSVVDHHLDARIPFTPSWITIYLDFVGFWVRTLSFLLHSYKRRSFSAARDFITSMGELYAFASETYRKNFSTTGRPFYIARPRFLLIHLVDPHLMCIPSLHVMVVIRTWTKFAAILRSFGDAERLAPQIEEMKQGALLITEAILFVKQHSVNCIAAALYAITCFDPELFPPAEAEAFTALLFEKPPAPDPGSASVTRRGPLPNAGVRPSAAPRIKMAPEDVAEIKDHIINLYRRFLSERETAKTWDEPLLKFLRPLPRKY